MPKIHTHTHTNACMHFCTKMNTCCLTKECERERQRGKPAGTAGCQYVCGVRRGGGKVNVRYVCMPSTTTTTAADSCSPNAVVFRRSLRLRERKRESERESARESATRSEIRAGQVATSNAKLSWPGVGR